MNDHSKLALAAVAGIAVGAIIGILFAPDKGSEIRCKIKNALKDLGGSMKDLSEKGLESVNKVTEEVKTNVGKNA